MILRRIFPYVPLGCGAYAGMLFGFVLMFFVALLYGAPGAVAVVFAMILGPFTGWILATLAVYLVLSPGERRRSREYEQRRRERAGDVRKRN